MRATHMVNRDPPYQGKSRVVWAREEDRDTEEVNWGKEPRYSLAFFVYQRKLLLPLPFWLCLPTLPCLFNSSISLTFSWMSWLSQLFRFMKETEKKLDAVKIWWRTFFHSLWTCWSFDLDFSWFVVHACFRYSITLSVYIFITAYSMWLFRKVTNVKHFKHAAALCYSVLIYLHVHTSINCSFVL